jgi:flagellar biosynthetic protein FliR
LAITPGAELLQWFSPLVLLRLFLVSGRIGGTLITAPLLKSSNVPPVFKLWFGVSLVVLAYTTLAVPSKALSTAIAQAGNTVDLALFLSCFTQELVVGLVLGFALNWLFEALGMAGEWVSTQMGLNMAQQIDPISGQNSQTLSLSLTQLGLVLALTLNWHHQWLELMMRSYDLYPLGYGMGAAGGVAWIGPWVQRLVVLGGHTFVWGFVLLAPVHLVLLLLECLLGYLAKLVPQMNLLVVSPPLKVGVGLLALWAVGPSLAPLFARHHVEWLHLAMSALPLPLKP